MDYCANKMKFLGCCKGGAVPGGIYRINDHSYAAVLFYRNGEEGQFMLLRVEGGSVVFDGVSWLSDFDVTGWRLVWVFQVADELLKRTVTKESLCVREGEEWGIRRDEIGCFEEVLLDQVSQSLCECLVKGFEAFQFPMKILSLGGCECDLSQLVRDEENHLAVEVLCDYARQRSFLTDALLREALDGSSDPYEEFGRILEEYGEDPVEFDRSATELPVLQVYPYMGFLGMIYHHSNIIGNGVRARKGVAYSETDGGVYVGIYEGTWHKSSVFDMQTFIDESIADSVFSPCDRCAYSMSSTSGRYVIDAFKRVGWGASVNHSCQPNMRTQVCKDACGNPFMCFYNIRAIQRGEELTISYDGVESFFSMMNIVCCGFFCNGKCNYQAEAVKHESRLRVTYSRPCGRNVFKDYDEEVLFLELDSEGDLDRFADPRPIQLMVKEQSDVRENCYGQKRLCKKTLFVVIFDPKYFKFYRLTKVIHLTT